MSDNFLPADPPSDPETPFAVEDETTESPEPKKKSVGLTILTSLLFLVSLAMLVTPFFWGMEEGFKPDVAKVTPWLDWAGDLHVLVLHVPIGIYVYILLMEIFGLLSFRKFKPQLTGALFVGAMSSVLAVVSGYLYFMQGDHGAAPFNADNLMGMHMWVSILFAVLFICTYVAKVWARLHGTPSPVYGFLLLFTGIALAYGSHQGGKLVHRDKDPVADFMALVNEEKEAPITTGAQTQEESEEKPTTDMLVYEDVVKPILMGKCWECHAEADLNPLGRKKIKGGLVMTDIPSLILGGDDAPAVVPGDVEASEMIVRVKKLPDDDGFMPTDDDHLTEGEIRILEWWISSLDPEQENGGPDRKVGEIPGHEALLADIEAVEPVNLEEKEEVGEEIPHVVEPTEREKLEEALTPILQAMPGAIRFVSVDSEELVFNAAGIGQDFTDAQLAELEPVAEALVELNLMETAVSDEGMKTVAKMTNLRRLMLNETEIGDQGVKNFASLPNLESLTLFGAPVGDEGVRSLAETKTLKRIYLDGTEASEAAVEELRAALPEAKIEFTPPAIPEPTPFPFDFKPEIDAEVEPEAIEGSELPADPLQEDAASDMESPDLNEDAAAIEEAEQVETEEAMPVEESAQPAEESSEEVTEMPEGSEEEDAGSASDPEDSAEQEDTPAEEEVVEELTVDEPVMEEPAEPASEESATSQEDQATEDQGAEEPAEATESEEMIEDAADAETQQNDEQSTEDGEPADEAGPAEEQFEPEPATEEGNSTEDSAPSEEEEVSNGEQSEEASPEEVPSEDEPAEENAGEEKAGEEPDQENEDIQPAEEAPAVD
ncbi:MAG: c-type cytochrome domain-containing protein [Verrucomicrobiota bacterium JB023]|nr:c-type cytochrome domain-containing protein [Verrucomicrobiota bacterium JB023]